MKKDFIRLSLSLIILISIFYIFQQKQIAKESITYFPIDPTVTFPKANTTLTFSKKDLMNTVFFGRAIHPLIRSHIYGRI
ncbi:hypothetical protein AAHB53_24820 [Niallia circulans]